MVHTGLAATAAAPETVVIVASRGGKAGSVIWVGLLDGLWIPVVEEAVTAVDGPWEFEFLLECPPSRPLYTVT